MLPVAGDLSGTVARKSASACWQDRVHPSRTPVVGQRRRGPGPSI